MDRSSRKGVKGAATRPRNRVSMESILVRLEIRCIEACEDDLVGWPFVACFVKTSGRGAVERNETRIGGGTLVKDEGAGPGCPVVLARAHDQVATLLGIRGV